MIIDDYIIIAGHLRMDRARGLHGGLATPLVIALRDKLVLEKKCLVKFGNLPSLP